MQTNRRKQRANALNGCIKVLEDIRTDGGGQLGPKTGEHLVLVHNQHFANPTHGCVQRLPVQGNKGTQVDDLHRTV